MVLVVVVVTITAVGLSSFSSSSSSAAVMVSVATTAAAVAETTAVASPQRYLVHPAIIHCTQGEGVDCGALLLSFFIHSFYVNSLTKSC